MCSRHAIRCCAIFAVMCVLPQLLDAAQTNWNDGIRHGHGRNGHSQYNRTGPYHHRAKAPQDVRQVYHNYQRGSVRVPHGGSAFVPNTYGRKKMYRGTVSTTILDGKPMLRRANSRALSTRHRNRDTDWELSRDEPVRTPDACAKCPPDRAVIAKRGSITTIMEKLPIIPCFPWSNVADVRHEIVLGPQPGHLIGEGSHSLVTRLIRFDRPVATCHARYNVIVRKCEPLVIQGVVKANCPLGEAWGATCTFSCPDGYQLVGAVTTECNNQLEWSDDSPQCAVTTSCTVPVTPENGHITCRTPQHKPVKSQNTLPDGTTCHYWCSAGFRIPPSQHQLETVSCMAGEWNSTQDPTCIESNSLQESSKELSRSHRHNHRLSSPRLGRKHCPKAKCQNGGRCYIILGEQLCMCKHGFTGPSCADQLTDNAIK